MLITTSAVYLICFYAFNSVKDFFWCIWLDLNETIFLASNQYRFIVRVVVNKSYIGPF